jgi:archaellum component FlaC
MEFSDNLTKISQNISKPEVINDIKAFKTDILNHLNEVNDSLTLVSNDLVNSDLSKNLMDFNTHVEKLNAFYDEVNKKDLEKPVKDLARKARETTTMLAEKTSNF